MPGMKCLLSKCLLKEQMNPPEASLVTGHLAISPEATSIDPFTVIINTYMI